MSPKPLKVAVAGAGLMGRVHAEAARECGMKVVAVADQDLNRAGKLARTMMARPSSIDDVFVSGVANAIHICTPPETHFALCARALQAGMHVICEKPVTSSASELESLLQSADERDLLLCPVHQFPFQRGVQRFTDRPGDLGTIRHVSAEMCTAGADNTSNVGRSQLVLDLVTHPLSLARAFGLAPLDSVSWDASMPFAGELIVSGSSGSIGISFLISTHSRPTSNILRVFGDAGTATIDLFHGYAYAESGSVSRWSKLSRPFTASALTFGHALENGMRRTVDRETSFPGMRELVRRFYTAINQRTTSPITPDEALDIARARDRIMSLVESPGRS